MSMCKVSGFQENESKEMMGFVYELLRSAVMDRDPRFDIGTTPDWDAMMKYASKEGVLAWLWDGICKLPKEQQPNRFQRISWDLSARQIWNRYELQHKVLLDILSKCNANQIRLLLMKGETLSIYYPKPKSRPSGDIDIFLFEDFEKGNNLFVQGQHSETDKHTSFYYKGVNVENHKVVINPNTETKKRVSEYIANSLDKVIYNPEGYYELSPIENFIFVMIHAYSHVHFGINTSLLNLKNITDLAVILNAKDNHLPASELIHQMKELHIEKTFDLTVYLSEWLLAVDLSQYHVNVVEEKDVAIIKDYFLHDGFYCTIPISLPYFKQVVLYWKRYHKIGHVYRYMPKWKSLNRLMLSDLYLVTMRKLFKVTNVQSFSEGIRQKYRNHNQQGAK